MEKYTKIIFQKQIFVNTTIQPTTKNGGLNCFYSNGKFL